MDTDSFIVSIKTDRNYKEIADDVEIRLDTSRKKRKKRLFGLLKDELGGKVLKEFVELRLKTQVT